MDHYSILDQTSPEPSVLAAGRSATASVSAGIAAANALLPNPGYAKLRSPDQGYREESGASLAEMAQADLDAALQLLTERAQYITGATGAAIALRRGDYKEMRCRATSGSNVPQLGSLLSTEHGLSGECVRTRKLLHCQDAERDSRVNRDVCRTLGIASVVVMPVVSDEKVLGVFEVLSDKASVFTERDLSALARLSEMVGTAVRHAHPAQAAALASDKAPAAPKIAPPVEVLRTELKSFAPALSTAAPVIAPIVEMATPIAQPAQKLKEEAVPAIQKKPLFWSAVMRAQTGTANKPESETIAVPAVLRGFQKCQACGFPVSPGRTFCVECEEKQWRGQPVAEAAPSQPASQPLPPMRASAAAAGAATSVVQQTYPAPILSVPPVPLSQPVIAEKTTPSEDSTVSTQPEISPDAPAPDISASFLSSALQSESWFAANKYVLGALLAVAITIAAVAFLR